MCGCTHVHAYVCVPCPYMCVFDRNMIRYIHNLYFFADGLSHMMTQTLVLPIIHSRENIGMLSLKMTTVPAQIYTNPTICCSECNINNITDLFIYFLFVPTLYACVNLMCIIHSKFLPPISRSISNLRCPNGEWKFF